MEIVAGMAVAVTLVLAVFLSRRADVLRCLITLIASALLVFLVVPRPAQAFDVNLGVGVGGVFAGTVPRLALSPHAGISWRLESGFLFELHDVLGIIPPISGRGAGVYNQTSASAGYASENVNLSLGPSLSIYFMPACRRTLCSRVVGIAPGLHGQANLYFAGPFGASVQANVDWIGGRSLVLPGGVAAMVVAGPVLRW